MKACIVCHKFIKQPKYCPKHEPNILGSPISEEDQQQRFLNELLRQGQAQQAQNLQGQMDLRAQQFGGIGGSSPDDVLRRGALGPFHPGQIIPVSTPPYIGPDVRKWIMPALSWVLNPITKLGLKLGILKNKEE